MRRVDLIEATMEGWARLNAAQRERFFEAFLKAALRLDRLALRAWLRRRLRNPPLAEPIDPTSLHICGCRHCPSHEGGGEPGRSCRRAGQGRGRWRLSRIAQLDQRTALPDQCRARGKRRAAPKEEVRV